ncbi:hypothetical protein AB5N19_09547 [Seiridium cardinale]
MPAVNPPLGQSRSNAISTLVPWDPQRLLANITVAVTALALLYAVWSVIRYRNRKHSRRRVTGLEFQENSLPQLPGPGNWEKSRGVSNSVVMDMSANQRTVSAKLGVEVGLDPAYDEASPIWNMDDASEKRGDNSSIVKTEVAMKHHLRARPPLPPPLTPPTLSTKTLSLEDRRLSSALSMTGDLDSNFFSQPNPDYTSSSSSSSAVTQPHDSPATPKRRSYTKTLPLGPPQPVSWLEEDGSVTAFSPSSFPSSSPTLPMAPHNSFHDHAIDVKGEIISVLDDSGAGWKRHTRVYGGGVCLACMASADGEGGFYGDRVRPEEKR